MGSNNQKVTVSVEQYNPEYSYDFTQFDCGVPHLNEFLTKKMIKECEAMVSRPYLLCFKSDDSKYVVKGYYTLGSHSLEKVELRGNTKRNCPYKSAPAHIIGKLAVCESVQGQKLGKRLLSDAIKRSHAASKTVGVLALVLHARKGTESFYEQAGWIRGKYDASLFIYPLKQYENEMKKLYLSRL